MQSNGTRLGAIKEVTRDGIFDVGAKLFPGVGLSNNVFREAFSDIAAIRLLNYFKYQIANWGRFHCVL